jgi:[citrate (pro-3S)-lyase] ligase
MKYQFREILMPVEKEMVKSLLSKHGLKSEDRITHTIGLFDGDLLVATGSIDDNVIKMLAVDAAYQGENLLSIVLTKLVNILNNEKKYKYFVFTKTENKKFFLDYNLFLIYEDDYMILFENKINTIVETLHDMKYKLNLKGGSTAALVMNCNPMTNGHLYLIETCAKKHDHVLIFLVEENRSVFPYDVRLKILKKSTKQIKNVHVLPSTPYIISRATFPTYFSKSLDEATKRYTQLDISLFKTYFMDIFNIDYRYVGTEPLDPLTNLYNQTMKEILGEKLIIIDRLSENDQPISASSIRKLIAKKDLSRIKQLVPKATYQFLKSTKGKEILNG